MADYWQKRHALLPQTYPEHLPRLSPDEIAWLATQADVDSRLILTERATSGDKYRVEQGPFTEMQLGELADTDWTLLVQDVDKHLPAFRQWFSLVSFIPDWRVDDLMVSVAAPGGSAGPHRDHYDVFLCQGTGNREWRLASTDDAIPDSNHPDMALLEPFEDSRSTITSEGQVLYLPAGVPHWGIAQDLCVTYSIGMRAPSQLEIDCGIGRVFPEKAQAAGRPQGGSDIFYTDPDLSADEAGPGEISLQSIHRARHATDADYLSDTDLAMAFGSVVTDPKVLLEPAQWSADEVSKLLQERPSDSDMVVHGMARIAWFSAGSKCLAFANGYGLRITPSQLRVMQDICGLRDLKSAGIAALLSNDADESYLAWLCRRGVFDLEHSGPRC